MYKTAFSLGGPFLFPNHFLLVHFLTDENVSNYTGMGERRGGGGGAIRAEFTKNGLQVPRAL